MSSLLARRRRPAGRAASALLPKRRTAAACLRPVPCVRACRTDRHAPRVGLKPVAMLRTAIYADWTPTPARRPAASRTDRRAYCESDHGPQAAHDRRVAPRLGRMWDITTKRLLRPTARRRRLKGPTPPRSSSSSSKTSRRRPSQFGHACTPRSNTRRISWAQVHPRRAASGSAVARSVGISVPRAMSHGVGAAAGVIAAGVPNVTTAARTRALGARRPPPTIFLSAVGARLACGCRGRLSAAAQTLRREGTRAGARR